MSEQAQGLIGCYIAEKFRVDALISADAFSAVYVAVDVLLDRMLALKIFWIYNGDTHEAHARMQREAMILARTEHINTRRIYEAGYDAATSSPYIAMEWIPGQILRHLMHLPMSTDQLLRVSRDITGGLSIAHQQGLCHGGLSADSIVLTTESNGDLKAKLLQLGSVDAQSVLARARALDPSVDALSVAYTSPEQWRGHPPDARSDVYAIGGLLYHMLCGSPPFSGSLSDLAEAHCEAPRPRLKARPGLDLPLLIDALVTRCLQRDPAHRFQGCRELHDVFCNLLREGSGRASDSVQAVAVDPLSRFVVIGRAGGRVDVHATDTGARLLSLDAHRGAVNALLFRPESDEFLSAGEDGHICLWSISERCKKGSWPGLRGSLYALAFSPLRYIFASGEIDGRVRLWSLSEDRPLGELQAHAGPVTALHFLPEGRFLASGGRDGSVRLWDIGSMALAETCPWQRGAVVSLSMRVRDRFVAAFEDGSMALGRWNQADPLWHHRIHRHAITHLFEQDGGQGILSIGLDGVINSVDQFDGDLRRAPMWLLEGVRAAFLHSRTESLYCSSDSSVMRWRWRSGQPLPTLEGFLAPDSDGWQLPIHK
jgi:eukaryotic-like serine/threonine-protein kinase